MTVRDTLLVVGGSGVVGQRIATHLATWFPGRVVVAGRNLERAETVSGSIGRGTRARRIDVQDPASIAAATSDASLVIAAVGQPDRQVLRAAVAQGLAYTDTAPYMVRWKNGDAFAEEAKRTGARVILGTGLAPGVSSVMAAAGAARTGKISHIESAVLLGADNVSGPDSMKFFFEEASETFRIVREGHQVNVRPFTDPIDVPFPMPFGTRRAYLFPFSDVVMYPRTLNASTAISRLAVDPSWSGALLAKLLAMRMPLPVLKAFRTLSGLKHGHADTFGLCVTVTGDLGEARYQLGGHDQASITALAAAEFGRRLIADPRIPAGIWCAEQVIEPGPFFARLALHGYTIAEHFSATEGRRISA